MIVCVQWYPEDGEQAEVAFIDLNDPKLPASVKGDIVSAMGSPYKMFTVTDMSDVLSYHSAIKPPVMVDDCVTIYWG